MPFVEGRARQLVFLRVGRARALIDALSPGTRPEALTELLVARLLGRNLGHELGHVLLNSQSHEDAGLMRAGYRDGDVLSVPTSAYTLNAVERARLFARMTGEPRLAARLKDYNHGQAPWSPTGLAPSGSSPTSVVSSATEQPSR